MNLAVLDKEGKSTGREIALPTEMFGIEPNEHVVYLAVKSYLAAKRQGTAKAKPRNEIAGSTKKLKKQKGTGTARAGSIKSPIFRGGGTVFGPEPRTYTLKLNKKERQLAKSSALSQKYKTNSIVIVEELNFEKPKTKDAKAVLGAIDATKKVLFVHNGDNENLVKSIRNIAKVKLSPVSMLNTYDLLHADKIVFTENAIKQIVE